MGGKRLRSPVHTTKERPASRIRRAPGVAADAEPGGPAPSDAGVQHRFSEQRLLSTTMTACTHRLGPRRRSAPRADRAPGRIVVALWALLAGASAAPAATAPESFSAKFVLEAHGMTVGSTELSLTPLPGGRAVYESRSATAGLLSLIRDDRALERSELLYPPHGQIRPLAYRYERTGSKNKTVTIDFDWEEGTALNTEKGRSWRFEIPEGTLDKLSYMLALMRDLRAGQREFHYPVNARGKLKTYHFEVVSEERVETALGPMQTLKVERVRNPANPRETVVWCAPRLGYFPVKIMDRDEDGTVTTLRIRSVDGLGLDDGAHADGGSPQRSLDSPR